MKRVNLSLPELFFIVGTRAALGVGIGMLAAQRLSRLQRRRVGLGLVTVGGLATIPAAMLIRQRRRQAAVEA
jgi:hypothetical protein